MYGLRKFSDRQYPFKHRLLSCSLEDAKSVEWIEALCADTHAVRRQSHKLVSGVHRDDARAVGCDCAPIRSSFVPGACGERSRTMSLRLYSGQTFVVNSDTASDPADEFHRNSTHSAGLTCVARQTILPSNAYSHVSAQGIRPSLRSRREERSSRRARRENSRRSLGDRRSHPPGGCRIVSRLASASLKGDLKGFWSVSVSGNWRIVFRFEKGDAFDVDLIDYH